jgi:hypothetical protein
MYFRYGSATFPINTFRLEGIRTSLNYEGLMPVGFKRVWALYGKLYSDTLADLNNRIRITDAAFSIQGQAAYILDNSGNITAHHLGASGSRNGCMVTMPPSYEPMVGIEMSRIRSFRVELSADYDFPAPGLVVRFNESVSIQGNGGPDEDYLECVIGRPIHQVLKQYTKVVYVQTGTIVGRYRHIFPSQWVREAVPGYRVGKLDMINPMTAEIRDGPIGNPVERNFPVNYTWVFKTPAFVNPVLNSWRN